MFFAANMEAAQKRASSPLVLILMLLRSALLCSTFLLNPRVCSRWR